MASLGPIGPFRAGCTADRLRADFSAAAASEAEVAGRHPGHARETGYLLEPHTACGVVASQKTADAHDRTVPDIVLATAHPAKFADAMADITGEPAGLPDRLAHLMDDAERVTVLDNDLAAVQRYILEMTRGA